jgi:hypothetical protein
MLPIDWRYIEALSAGLDLKIRKDDRPRWCAELLEGTPTVRLFELDFNAFATVHARLGNRPCICMYDHLMFACYWVLEFLYAYVFRDRDPAAQGFRIPSGEKLRERGRQPAFVDECVNYLKLLYRRKSPAFVPEGGTRFSRVSPQVFWHFSAAVAGACDFVWHHECAHLLMGHLEIGPCHQVEFEADDFAWSVIRATNYNGPALSPWYRIGAVSMLTLIAVLDLIAGSDSATHPPGTARLSRIFARLTPADGLDAFVVNRAILILCEGPVESAFGIRYRVDEARRP